MSLAEYKKKRDFRRTPEPGPGKGKSHRSPVFVVQEHHASRLHYDFRLEADGVLKSWAVPKKPTLEPASKRLAVHVEDHPLGYADFSGVIPEGEYGAGEVRIWDKGTYENLMAEKSKPRTVSESIEDGHVEVELHGGKLKGRFAIVRMNGRGAKDNWLLVKMKDGGHSRPEKPVRSAKSARRGSRTTPAPVASGKKSATERRLKRKSASPARIKFTNTDRIMFPEVGITKGDILEYYERIAPRLLPHLCDRPATLERVPYGLVGRNPTHFWQKDVPDYYPSWIPRVTIPAQTGEQVRYALVNDLETLLYLVNQGTITIHPWLSRVSNIHRPDYVIFDLDRGDASFRDVVVVAKRLHSILTDAGLESFVKTSGKSGLHVLVPWRKDQGYDQARAWARAIAKDLMSALPDVATVERSKRKRGSRVYVDVMQNVLGHHVVPPYVLRAVPAASISTPLRWRELSEETDPSAFNLKTIFRRLGKLKTDPLTKLAKSYGC
jgi:bifunctional non-homologous end joining protein LigD